MAQRHSTIDPNLPSMWRDKPLEGRKRRDGPFFAPTAGTLDGWLLDSWHGGSERYDALFLEGVTSASQACSPACLGLNLVLLVGHDRLFPCAVAAQGFAHAPHDCHLIGVIFVTCNMHHSGQPNHGRHGVHYARQEPARSSPSPQHEVAHAVVTPRCWRPGAGWPTRSCSTPQPFTACRRR